MKLNPKINVTTRRGQYSSTHYYVLGVAVAAPLDVINARFKELSVLHHPDRKEQEGPEAVAAAEANMALITKAYELLKDAKQRREYDTLLHIAGLNWCTRCKGAGRRIEVKGFMGTGQFVQCKQCLGTGAQ